VHGEQEKRTGQHDRPDWYADYIVRKQAGRQLPCPDLLNRRGVFSEQIVARVSSKFAA
jgi:hypothetical protein